MEDWVIARIKTIQHGTPTPANVFDDSDVTPWEGTDLPNAKMVGDELMSRNRPTIAKVFFFSDEPEDLEGGSIKTVGQIIVYVGVRNFRQQAEGRRGDAAKIGTNGLRSKLQYVLHNQKPDVTDNVYYTDKTRWAGCELLLAEKNHFILQALIKVDEVPKQG